MRERAHRLGVTATILALVTLVGVVYAQTPTTSSTTTSWTTSAVSGTVMSVDPQAKTVAIKTDAGSTQAFLLADPIWMRSAGKDIAINELKVGDRVRIEPTPGAGADEPTRTASRLEVLGTSASGSAQRTVSTERPVLGESSDAGEDRDAMPSSAGSTTGRTVSTDRPVLGQSPPPETTTTGSTSINTTGTSTYGSSTTPAGTSSTTSSTNSQTSADELPATASPLPMLGVLGLLALAAGFAVRATRKQHS